MTSPGISPGSGMLHAVGVQHAGPVATITVGTGERFNALGSNEWRELERIAASLSSDGSLRAVVVRGRGGVFCSGSDLREWDGATAEQVRLSFASMESALQALEEIPVPTVAVVEGVATGAGCQLALACDLQLTAASARIGMPVSRLGILVPPSFANRMSLRIGPSRTKDLLYGGRLLGAAEAHGMGLITTVVPDDDVDGSLLGILGGWEAVSPASLRAAKAAVDRGLRPLTQPARDEPQGPASDPAEFSWRVASFLHRRSA